jgi:hypothetical protein
VRRVPERPLEQRGDLAQELHARGRRARQPQAPFEDVEAIAVASLLLVEPGQRLEGVLVLGVLVEDADARGDRLLDVAHVALEQAGHAPPELLARARVRGEVDALAQDLHARAVLRARLEDPLEGVDRLALLGIVLQDAAQGGDRLVGVAERLLPRGRRCGTAAVCGVLTCLGLRPRRDVGPARLHLQDLHQRRDVAGLARYSAPAPPPGARRLHAVDVEVQDQLPGSMAARRFPSRLE